MARGVRVRRWLWPVGLVLIAGVGAAVSMPGPQLDWLGLRDSYPHAQTCQQGLANPEVARAARDTFPDTWDLGEVSAMDSRGIGSCYVELPDGALWLGWGHVVPDQFRSVRDNVCEHHPWRPETGLGDESYSCSTGPQRSTLKVLTGWQDLGVSLRVEGPAADAHIHARCLAEALAGMRDMPVTDPQCPPTRREL